MVETNLPAYVTREADGTEIVDLREQIRKAREDVITQVLIRLVSTGPSGALTDFLGVREKGQLVPEDLVWRVRVEVNGVPASFATLACGLFEEYDRVVRKAARKALDDASEGAVEVIREEVEVCRQRIRDRLPRGGGL